MANTDGAKAVGTIMSIAAVVAAMAAIMAPMNQRINQQSALIVQLQDRMAVDDERERQDAADIATISQKFTEVNTQLHAVREVSAIRAGSETEAIRDLQQAIREIAGQVAVLWSERSGAP